MKAMILAAGRGERMRPLTDHTPKPLLMAGGKPLIVWHLERLAAAGFKEIVINHAHLGAQIEQALGDGSQWGLSIQYSAEPPGALETAGGIATALPLLGKEPFLVVNGDVYCDFDFGRFSPCSAPRRNPQRRASHAGRLAVQEPYQHPWGVALASEIKAFAHLVMVDNPAHNTKGDFSLNGEHVAFANGEQTLTYAGIGIFSPDFFAEVKPGSIMKLRPLLDAAIVAGTLTGERHTGRWVDVGTPQRLTELDAELRMQ